MVELLPAMCLRWVLLIKQVKDIYRSVSGLFNGFSYVVFYCETAEVNFGAAQLN